MLDSLICRGSETFVLLLDCGQLGGGVGDGEGGGFLLEGPDDRSVGEDVRRQRSAALQRAFLVGQSRPRLQGFAQTVVRFSQPLVNLSSQVRHNKTVPNITKHFLIRTRMFG